MTEEEQLKRIADSLEKVVRLYEHPEEFMQRFSQGLQDTMGQVQSQLMISAPPSGVSAVRAITVSIDPKEKEEITKTVMSEIEQQMEEFRGFIAESLAEMPDDKLKKIAEHIKAGRKFKLRRRPPDCITLDFGYGDEEFFLRL